jgi:hypothetical protein
LSDGRHPGAAAAADTSVSRGAVEAAVDAAIDDPAARAMRRRLRVLAIGVTVAFAAFDAWLVPRSTLIVTPGDYAGTAKAVAALLVALASGALVGRRFRHDPSSMGRFVRTMAAREIVFAKAALIFAAFTAVAVLFMYLASNTTAPLVDDRLAALDAAIGFDWVRWLARTNAVPHLPTVLALAYGTTHIVLAGVLAWLSFTRPEERVLELLALVAVTSLFTGILLYLLPAAGAFVLFDPPAALFDKFPAGAGVWHYHTLLELRSGKPFEFAHRHAVGLVTFPSFHTMLAIVTTYAARGLRVVFPCLLVLNTVMIVSTVPYGGHYLVDVLAGGAIALLVIVGVRAFAGAPAK